MAKKKTKKSEDANTVNLKLDAETKADIDALVFIKDTTKQELCLNFVKKGLEPYADKIAEVRKFRE